ncbi:MAG: class I SAM-dependent methyltransferase [Candidatus Acidiferrum sp.]
MGLLNKLGIAIGGQAPRESARPQAPKGRSVGNGNTAVVAAGPHREPQMQEITRVSNGLKEFLWNLDGLGRGTLLDLGPAWQTTLNFFIERGFRVTSDDILRDWSEFQSQESASAKERLTPEEYAQRTPEALAKKFLEENLQYPAASFDALLLWDSLDYLDPVLVKSLVGHLTEMLRPGGVVLGLFHSKKPEGFQRYRVMDTNTLQVLSTKPILPAQKPLQNREIQELFGRFRTMKSFVGRDQLRESLFIK